MTEISILPQQEAPNPQKIIQEQARHLAISITEARRRDSKDKPPKKLKEGGKPLTGESNYETALRMAFEVEIPLQISREFSSGQRGTELDSTTRDMRADCAEQAAREALTDFYREAGRRGQNFTFLGHDLMESLRDLGQQINLGMLFEAIQSM